jgi:hypothetical protein
MECSCENSPNGGEFLHPEIPTGATGPDKWELNPRLLALSPYAVERAPQQAATWAKAMEELAASVRYLALSWIYPFRLSR